MGEGRTSCHVELPEGGVALEEGNEVFGRVEIVQVLESEGDGLERGGGEAGDDESAGVDWSPEGEMPKVREGRLWGGGDQGGAVEGDL